MGKNMKKVLVLSANLGNFDKPVDHAPQDMECTMIRVTDETFLPRRTMSPRLQARIVKMFGWQVFPGYDYYLWVDSSCRLSSPSSVRWFLDQLKGNNIAVFKHPQRQTVQEEADYLKHRLKINCPYITPRYENELIDEQLAEADPSAELYASTALIYRNTPAIHQVMKEWWYHTSRFHAIDQLSLPFVLRGSAVSVIPDNYQKCEALEYVRK